MKKLLLFALGIAVLTGCSKTEIDAVNKIGITSQENEKITLESKANITVGIKFTVTDTYSQKYIEGVADKSPNELGLSEYFVTINCITDVGTSGPDLRMMFFGDSRIARVYGVTTIFNLTWVTPKIYAIPIWGNPTNNNYYVSTLDFPLEGPSCGGGGGVPPGGDDSVFRSARCPMNR